MRFTSSPAVIVGLAVVAVSASSRTFATEQAQEIPAWLKAHVGDGEGQIAPVVLQRARALYLQKVSQGAVKNPCYFAMDATRPGRVRAPVLRDLRSRPVVPRGAIGARQRSQRGGREFLERYQLREEFQQRDGFQADHRWPICDGRDQDLVQRLLSFSGKIRRVQPLFRAVRWRGRYRECQAPRHRRTSGRRVADRVSAKGSGKSVR